MTRPTGTLLVELKAYVGRFIDTLSSQFLPTEL